MRPRRCSSHALRNGPGSRLGACRSYADAAARRQSSLWLGASLSSCTGCGLTAANSVGARRSMPLPEQGHLVPPWRESTPRGDDGRGEFAGNLGSASAGRCTEIVPPHPSEPIMWRPNSADLGEKREPRETVGRSGWRLEGAAAIVNGLRRLLRQGSAIDGMSNCAAARVPLSSPALSRPAARLRGLAAVLWPSFPHPCRSTAQWRSRDAG